MQYLALIGSDEAQEPEPGSPEFITRMEGHMRFGELAGEAIRGGAALHLTPTAATIRQGDGGPLVTDGPYAETSEAIGGYYVLEAESLDDAIELGRQIPLAPDSGWLTLRPLWGYYPNDANPEVTGQRFVAMAYGKETDADQPGSPGWEAAGEAHMAFAAEAGDAVLAGVALHPATMATTLQVRDGDVVVTDGTLNESADVTACLYLLQAADLDGAVAVAKRIPAGPDRAIEVRPVREIG